MDKTEPSPGLGRDEKGSELKQSPSEEGSPEIMTKSASNINQFIGVKKLQESSGVKEKAAAATPAKSSFTV